MAPDSSRGTAQQFGDFAQGTIESAAAGFDEFTCGVAHALHFLLIFKEVNPLHAGVFGIVDLDGGAGFEESRGNGGEIFHGIAEDGNFAESGRLQNIVTTGRNERTTDEDAIGNAIKGGELTDAVEEENGDVVGNVAGSAVDRNAWAGNGEFGAANEFAMRFVDEFGGGGEAFWLARSEDEKSFGKISLDDTEGNERKRFFGGHNAAGDDDGPTAAALGFLGQPCGEGRRRGQSHVVLEISADDDTIGRRSKSEDTLGVLLGLHQERGSIGKRGGEERLQVETEQLQVALKASERFFRNATAEENDGNAAVLGFPKEVGPNFGFKNDHDGGTNRVEEFAHTECPIEREVNHSIGVGDALFCQGVAGDGGSGNDESAKWVSVAEALGEGDSRKRFADGNGVNPDGARTVRGQLFQLRYGKAEALS